MLKKRGRRTLTRSSNKRVKKRFKSFIFALFSIFITSIIFAGILAYKFVNAPFSEASLSSKFNGENVWAKDRVNIVLVEVKDINDKFSDIKTLELVSFDVGNSEYAFYSLPVDTQVEYALNYGKGPLKHVYSVGNNDDDRGVYLLKKTLTKILAIKVDGFVLVDEAGLKKVLSKMGEVDKKDVSSSVRLKNMMRVPGAALMLREVAATNLKISDIYKIVLFFRGTSAKSAYVYKLSEEVLTNPESFDRIWRKNLKVTDIEREGIKVFIANSSHDPKIPGLANWGARVVENLGGSVLETQNAFVEFDENTLITENTDLRAYQEIKDVLDINKTVYLEDLNRDENYNPQIFRTKVSLVLVND